MLFQNDVLNKAQNLEQKNILNFSQISPFFKIQTIYEMSSNSNKRVLILAILTNLLKKAPLKESDTGCPCY